MRSPNCTLSPHGARASHPQSNLLPRRYPVTAAAAMTLGLAAACGSATEAVDATERPTLGAVRQSLSIGQQECRTDPRVQLGLVSEQVCAGAKVFFEETFDGNGRTCGTCHRVENNYTVDADFIAQLPADDALFVGAPGSVLDGLESPHLTDGHALIKEHVDGFEDEPNKFSLRSVPHILSMSTALSRRLAQRLGWSGDAVSDGQLGSFLEAGIRQHFPTRLERVAGRDFRLPTQEEVEQVEVFQRSLGRVERMNLNNVQFNNATVELGRLVFTGGNESEGRSRCGLCHSNGSARSVVNGRDSLTNTGVEALIDDGDLQFPTVAGVLLRDGGRGGQGLELPNFPEESPNSFGSGLFNTQSVIEAADTGPWFHNNGVEASTPGGMLDLVEFYATPADEGGKFNRSPGRDVFGAVSLSEEEKLQLAQFLRAINGAFNLNMVIQRLEAAQTVALEHMRAHAQLQRGLVLLAEEELDDALLVLGASEGPEMFAIERSLLQSAKSNLSTAATTFSSRRRLSNIRDGLALVRFAFRSMGSGLEMPMGEGNLMF